MKKISWILLTCALNLTLILFFLYFYRDFRSPAILPVSAPVLRTESPTEKTSTSQSEGFLDKSPQPFSPHSLHPESPQAYSQKPFQNLKKAKESPMPSGVVQKRPILKPEPVPLKSDNASPEEGPKAEKESEKAIENNESPRASQAYSSDVRGKIATQEESAAKTISQFPLFVGMMLLLSIFLNLALLLLYRSFSSKASLAQKRQDFVSAVTHELRTPLTSIKMFGEILEEGMVSTEEKKKEYYRLINKESGRLSRLIDNILQLTSLEKKSYHPQLVSLSLENELQEILPQLELLAQKSGFHILHHFQTSLPSIPLDREALRQILFIFLENSLKFASHSPDKTLEMALTRSDEKTILTWKDQGPGVPEKEISKIFEPFYRVESELTRKTKGTGIGLAMAKMLANSMGFEIRAENLNPGFCLLIIF